MEIKKIVLQGNDNVLRYSLSNGADVANDPEIITLIEHDMTASITLDDVNFYELSALTHIYRDQIRVLQEEPIGEHSDEYFENMFPGTFTNTKTGEEITTAHIVRDACDGFMNIALQMQSDEDIIPYGIGRMFVPIAYRKYSISIPFSYGDFVTCLQGSNTEHLFTGDDYNSDIEKYLKTQDGESFANRIMIALSQVINGSNRSERMNQLISLIKYQSLGKNDTEKLYKFVPTGFSKLNTLSGIDDHVLFFQGNPEKISERMSIMKHSKTPLKVEFAVLMPIQQLQSLESSFSVDDVKVEYQSTPVEIMEVGFQNGIRFTDFIVPHYDEDLENREELLSEYEASVSAYKSRIKSATENAFAASGLLLDALSPRAMSRYDPSCVVALLPTIALTRAVITLDSSKESKYRNSLDDFNRKMLVEMLQTMIDINKSINQSTP